MHLAAMAPCFHGNPRLLLSLNRLWTGPDLCSLGGNSTSCEVILAIRIEVLPGSCCGLKQFAYTSQYSKPTHSTSSHSPEQSARQKSLVLTHQSTAADSQGNKFRTFCSMSLMHRLHVFNPFAQVSNRDVSSVISYLSVPWVGSLVIKHIGTGEVV